MIGSQRGERPQAVRTEVVARTLADLAVEALVGDSIQPVSRLAIDISEVREVPQRPEVLTYIANAAAFHLALLPASGRITGAGIEVVLAGEGQEPRIEADQGAIVFGHGSYQIVIPTFAPHGVQSLKSMEVATDEEGKRRKR
jgi:hypothetical protein